MGDEWHLLMRLAFQQFLIARRIQQSAQVGGIGGL